MKYLLLTILIIIGLWFITINIDEPTYIPKTNDTSCIRLEARITKYAWTGNKMANNKYPEQGYVASSNRNIPFGTKVIIDNVEYEVGDRTNKRIESEFSHTTFDIYSEQTRQEMLEYGAKIKTILICK